MTLSVLVRENGSIEDYNVLRLNLLKGDLFNNNFTMLSFEVHIFQVISSQIGYCKLLFTGLGEIQVYSIDVK